MESTNHTTRLVLVLRVRMSFVGDFVQNFVISTSRLRLRSRPESHQVAVVLAAVQRRAQRNAVRQEALAAAQAAKQ